jgi:hypothetical protein
MGDQAKSPRSPRTLRARGAAALIAALTLAAAAAPLPTFGAALRPCRPSIEVSASQVLAGETVTVSGTLQCPEGVEAGGQTVTLFSHSPAGASGFAPVAEAVSDADGSYSIPSPALEANTIFDVRDGRGHSARLRVRVAPQLSLVAPPDGTQLLPGGRGATTAATNTIAFTGTVTPAIAGELVVLQRERPDGSGKWRRIATTRVDESGNYAITHTFRRAGTATVRVVVRSHGVLVLAASEPRTYTIASRQVTRPLARAARPRRRIRQ